MNLFDLGPHSSREDILKAIQSAEAWIDYINKCKYRLELKASKEVASVELQALYEILQSWDRIYKPYDPDELI